MGDRPKEQALTRIERTTFDTIARSLPADGIFLRVWTPTFARVGSNAPVNVTLEAASHSARAQTHWRDPKSATTPRQHLTLDLPVSYSDDCCYERVYALPSALVLRPETTYRIFGQIPGQAKPLQIFNFAFRTDDRGLPVAY